MFLAKDDCQAGLEKSLVQDGDITDKIVDIPRPVIYPNPSNGIYYLHFEPKAHNWPTIEKISVIQNN